MRRLLAAYRRWKCEQFHHHVLTWDSSRSMTVLYLQCTEEECGLASSGIPIAHRLTFQQPTRRPHWWSRFAQTVYLDPHDGQAIVTPKLMPPAADRQQRGRGQLWALR